MSWQRALESRHAPIGSPFLNPDRISQSNSESFFKMDHGAPENRRHSARNSGRNVLVTTSWAWARRTLAVGITLSALVLTRAADESHLSESTTLAEYVARPDPDFGWIERSAGRLGRTGYVELSFVSQQWRGVTWRHQLYIVKPSTLNPEAKHAMLVIAGRSWKDEYAEPTSQSTLPKSAPIYAELAEKIGTPVAVLLQVPFQPLFDNLSEDWLIAHTFEQYMETGEEDWPLLLPMVKSCVRAMDAVQIYTKKKWGLDLQTFTVTGASKRGWTTWLTGAVDERATAIAPMVIDVLNMGPQMKHAKATWGAFSKQVEPYTKSGLLDRLDTDEGKRLLQIVDPYSYRRTLDQPKLIINGTNDDYWVTDATNLYWDDLSGQKYLLYVPNNGHGLRDYGRVIGSVLALHQHQAGANALPRFEWKFTEQPNGVSVTATAEPRPDAMRVWTTTSPTPDLRKSTWRSQTLRTSNGTAEYRLGADKDFRAFFIEAEFRDGRPLPLYLSTTMRILSPPGAGAPPIAGTQ
jgi:PhoPQ-activated pathogenicity-related protein